MSDSPAIEIFGLRHAYKSHVAVSDVTFTVGQKSIHGFVGPNGAGKTTTLKVLATLLAPQTGSVQVFGHKIVQERNLVRRRIGYMPDHFSMYRQMTVFEYLDFFGAAYGLNQRQRDQVIGDVLALTDMAGRRNDYIQGLSRGMQQRVSLARVLVHDPDLLLLDEPASGLDPRARIELMEILQELRSLGKTIFIVGYILTLAAEHANLLPTLLALPGVTAAKQMEAGEFRYSVQFDKTRIGPNAMLQAVLSIEAQIVAFQEDVKHLNDAFMDLTDPGVRT